MFVGVAEEGSFSSAGRRLHRVQSAVSYGVANLEETLGVTLFDRSARRPQLTDVGQALLADARRVLARVDRLHGRAASLASGLETEVAVAIDSLLPIDLVVELCRQFRVEYPTVPLKVCSEALGAVSALVLDGTCQLGVTGPVVAPGDALQRRSIAKLPMAPVVAKDHALAAATKKGLISTFAVRDHVQIVVSDRSSVTAGIDHAVLSGMTWRVADPTTKIAMIRAGLGWGNLPMHMVEEDLRDGTLVRLTIEEWGDALVTVALSVVARADSPPGPAGQWFMERLELLCRDHPGLRR